MEISNFRLTKIAMAQPLMESALCCSQQWLQKRFLPDSMCALPSKDFTSYSARQLRNYLLQDLQISRSIVDKILDRRELKDLAETMLFASQYGHCQNVLREVGYYVIFLFLLIFVLVTFRERVWLIFRFLFGNFINISQLEQRFFIVRKSIKKYRSLLGAFSILVACILDGTAFYIQISALLSWIIPQHWTVYRYLWFGIPLPINTSDILSQYVGSKSNNNVWKSFTSNNSMKNSISGNGWTVNAGPMLTLSALRFVATKLDNFAAYRLILAKGPRRKKRESEDNDKLQVDDPYANRDHVSTGRGHRYSANYRNNTEDSVKWLLKSSSQKVGDKIQQDSSQDQIDLIESLVPERSEEQVQHENIDASNIAIKPDVDSENVSKILEINPIQLPSDPSGSHNSRHDEDDDWASDF